MKKKLEAELISIAHRILQLKDGTPLSQLQEDARSIYEQLTVLKHLESQSQQPQPTVGNIITPSENKPIEDLKKPVETPEVIINETAPEVPESKPEIIIEEINAKVTEDLFVPATEQQPISTPVYEKNDMVEIGEEIKNVVDGGSTLNSIEEKPKSLNDQLKKGIQIGLNDRLAFIKHLFEGSTTDYNRVLSQLNTLHNQNEANEFIQNMVKPDYQNWDGKEEFEQRFMNLVLNKFEN